MPILIILLFLSACASRHNNAEVAQLSVEQKILSFTLAPAHHSTVEKRTTTWATEYHIHVANNNSSGFAVKNEAGQTLATLSREDWCHAALEGTVRIHNLNGSSKTFNFAGVGDVAQVDCKSFFPTLAPIRIERMSKVFFRPSRSEFGEGFDNKLAIIPFRSIAVDLTLNNSEKFKLGQVVYIPTARGTQFVWNGKTYSHDGYFYIADTGGALHNNHIDVFIGDAKKNPFHFVKGPQGLFELQVLKRPDLQSAFSQIHAFK